MLGHAHLHSCTYSTALSAEYCIVDIPHNTAIQLTPPVQKYELLQNMQYTPASTIYINDAKL